MLEKGTCTVSNCLFEIIPEKMFKNEKISGPELYSETINNLEEAAFICIPKAQSKEVKRHDVPHWRERMEIFHHRVDILLQQQFMYEGPNFCPGVIRAQLRMAKSQYRRQLRILRREISANIADYTTTKNCFRKFF